MWTTSDLKFLSVLKLKLNKTITPTYLNRLVGVSIKTPSDFITAAAGTDVSLCLQKEIKISEIPQSDVIYAKLLSCWTSNLKELMTKIGPGRKLTSIVNTYIGRYPLMAVIYGIAGNKTVDLPYPLNQDIFLVVKEAKTFADLIESLKKKSREDLKPVIEILQNYRDYEIREVDPYDFILKARKTFWSMVADEVRKAGGGEALTRCMNRVRKVIPLIHEVRKAELTEHDISKVLQFFDPKEQEILKATAEDYGRLESFLIFGELFRCLNEIHLSPLGIETLLQYLILKDWETFFVTHTIYALSMGYSPEYLKQSLERWLWLYELTSK